MRALRRRDAVQVPVVVPEVFELGHFDVAIGQSQGAGLDEGSLDGFQFRCGQGAKRSNPKARGPKSERSPKSEVRMRRIARRLGAGGLSRVRVSGLGLPSVLGFGVSGFRPTGCVCPAIGPALEQATEAARGQGCQLGEATPCRQRHLLHVGLMAACVPVAFALVRIH